MHELVLFSEALLLCSSSRPLGWVLIIFPPWLVQCHLLVIPVSVCHAYVGPALIPHSSRTRPALIPHSSRTKTAEDDSATPFYAAYYPELARV